MLSIFQSYLQLGLEHILDFNGFDHLLFIGILTLGCLLNEWKKLVYLASAFTVGHSLTLALAVLKIFVIDAALIETLIPITILLTLVLYFLQEFTRIQPSLLWQLILVFSFGLIHGMGFSNYLNAILFKDESVFIPLLSFNLGVELAQILIIMAFMLLNQLVNAFFKNSFTLYSWLLALVFLALTISLFW